ncbi:hypothetical protein [Paenibacillus sp. GCM10027626]|uniref:hypothetical protein n=1 Tax=Paenibacillus sp. GCM10027626 TaxID=3273411 RepID=UPI0036327087
MTIDIGRLGSREVLKLQVFDYVTQKPLMHFDYANTSTYEGKSTRVFAMGAGTKRIAWDGEKELTLTVETQLFSLEHLALITGESIVSGARDIYEVETLVVGADKKLELRKTPIGAENGVAVFPYINGVITHDSQAIESVTDKTVTLDAAATVKPGDEVQVYYQYQVMDSKKVSFTANGFPKYVKLVGDTLYVDELRGEAIDAQLVYYKAKLQPNFTIASSSSGDPSSLSLVFDLFPVKVNGEDTIADLVLYED